MLKIYNYALEDVKVITSVYDCEIRNELDSWGYDSCDYEYYADVRFEQDCEDDFVCDIDDVNIYGGFNLYFTEEKDIGEIRDYFKKRLLRGLDTVSKEKCKLEDMLERFDCDRRRMDDSCRKS